MLVNNNQKFSFPIVPQSVRIVQDLSRLKFRKFSVRDSRVTFEGRIGRKLTINIDEAMITDLNANMMDSRTDYPVRIICKEQIN